MMITIFFFFFWTNSTQKRGRDWFLKRSGDTLHTRAHIHTHTHTTSRQLHVLSFVSGTCLVEQRGLLFQNSMSGVFLVWKGTTLDPRYLFDRGGAEWKFEME